MRIKQLIKTLIDGYKLKSYLKKCKVRTGGRIYIEHPENTSFEGDIYIGPDAYWSAKGGIEIRKNVIFGPKTTIWTYNHNYKSSEVFPYDENDILKSVLIKEDVWVGLGSIIMPGVTIHEGAIVAAGSVVVKDVPKCAIVAGNPASVVGYRDELSYSKVTNESRYMLQKK
jgi:acetyltransferase-like isoleucine patch superfamily enzyme